MKIHPELTAAIRDNYNRAFFAGFMVSCIEYRLVVDEADHDRQGPMPEGLTLRTAGAKGWQDGCEAAWFKREQKAEGTPS